MRLETLAVALLLSASAVAASYAQAGNQTVDGRFADERGQLLVWRVVATSPPRPFTPASLDPRVKSQTSGSFGQTSGSFGQTAGSTGQTASSIGQPSSNTGRTAGSTGRTAGSFGESLGTIAAAAGRSNGSAVRAKSDLNWDTFTLTAHSRFPALNVVYEEVGVDELESKLHDASARSPDVLIGTPLPSSWSDQESGLVRRYGLVTLGVAEPIAQEENPKPVYPNFKVEASILRAAPNPRGARAFVLWLDGQISCGWYCDTRQQSAEVKAAIAVARSALSAVLNGEGLGSLADREAAPFNPQLAQQAALNVYAPGLLANLKVRMETPGFEVNPRFAVVALEAVVEGEECFGLVHTFVVLRKDEAGLWRVLQITPNLPREERSRALVVLGAYASLVAPPRGVTVLGISQAAPVDGDNREASPELWWDNRGGATLEVVEWQRKADVSSTDATWINSNLFFVPDDSGHLRTRVTGRFADSPGPYRWRIWSVGRGGVIVISPWRSLNIIPH